MYTEILSLIDPAILSYAVDRTAEVLTRGGVVIFPTETVYGIGCDAANSSAVKRLQEIKGQNEGKLLQHLVPSVSTALSLCASPGRVAEKLMRCYWPGPLTLVLPRAVEGTIGIRLPDHPVLRAILQKCGLVLAASSANLHGSPPAHSGYEVIDVFAGKVDMILDEGTVALGLASSVVEVSRKGLKFFREEALSSLELNETARFTVLVLDAGGQVTGPLAAHILYSLFEKTIPEIKVFFQADDSSPWKTEPEAVLSVLPCCHLVPQGALIAVDDAHSVLNQSDLVLYFSKDYVRDFFESAPSLSNRSLYIDGISSFLSRVQSNPVESGYRDVANWLESSLFQQRGLIESCLA